MSIIFDNHSCKNLDRKYAQIGLNQFKNDYLREIAVTTPHLREYLKVYTQEYEIKLPNIIINQENYDIVTGVVQQNLKSALQSNVNTNKFYGILKQQNLNDNDQKDDMKVAMFNFYESSGGVKYQKIHSSNLMKHDNNIFYINSIKLTKQESQGLNRYFKSFNQIKEMHTKQIIIDQCTLDDQMIELILDGVIQQTYPFQSFGQEKLFNSLLTFVAINIPFGFKSMQKLFLLMPDLVEIKLNGLIMEQETFVPYLDQILQKYIYFGKYLMKLTLSNMNLSNKTLMNSLTQVLQERKHLQYLDFQNTKLNPDLLQILTNEMENQCMQYRDINLSYNSLDFRDEESEAYKTSYVVLQNLRHLLEHNIILNHLNLSGMNFQRNQMLEIFNSCIRSPLLMTLHLNDNGINMDQSMFADALEIFKIEPNDLPPQRKVFFPNSIFYREPISSSSNFNLDEKVQMYFRYQNGDQSQNLIKSNEIKKMKEIKESIIIGKELKDLNRLKQINKCKFQNGVGRILDSQQDYFTISRILNHPELIFNQNLNNDSNPEFRFFQKDHQSSWKLSVKNECFICDRHQYCIVFYQRDVLAQNKDLTEIFDQEILDFLNYEYKKNYTIYRTDTPLICGTLVNRNRYQNIFDRKLKMLSTPIFSMLSIIQAKDFANRNILVEKMKNGVQNYLKFDKQEYLEKIRVKQCMIGWEQIINDMTLNNELYDLKVINIPNLIDKNLSNQNWFTFAGFFNAGYQQILIYDPLMNRAFCKDFVIHLNKRDFVYPEYPTPQGGLVKKNVPNMWSKWLEDSEEELDKIQIQDAYQNFETIDKFIRNKEDTKNCLHIIRDFMERILIYQKELLVKSNCFPQINWESIIYFIEQVHSSQDFDLYKVPRAIIELQFIQSNRKQGQAVLGGSLKRNELVEFILRFAKTIVTESISARESISKHLSYFLRLYVGSVAETSNYTNYRRIIRKSSKLNELLFDNNHGLSIIFDDAKKQQGKGIFDLKTARQFFEKFNNPGMMKLKNRIIDECFIFSMMTVANEKQLVRKYDYLIFVEFQELICRIAYVGFEELDPIEYKVYWLLEYFWNDKYSSGAWTQEKMPLKPINNEVIF